MPNTRTLEVPNFAALGKGVEELHKNLPDIVAISAINFFQDRFKEKGWIDNSGLESWENRKDANANGSLLLVSGFLRDAFDYETSKNQVNVKNYAPYSSIHNEGGVISHPGGTHYIIIHGRAVFISNRAAENLKSRGKTVKKTQPHLIKIVQRQFMGHSAFFMNTLEADYFKQLKKLEQNTL